MDAGPLPMAAYFFFDGRFGGLARRFLFVGRLVERLARAFRHARDDFPRRLVVDREEAIGAVEGLLHLGGKR
jgi:hypothetical protein